MKLTVGLHQQDTVRPIKASVKRKWEDGTIITFFLAPALIVYLVYVVYSIFMTFFYSMFKWSGIEAASDFIGLANYVQLMNDGVFWKSLTNNLILVATSVLTQIPLGLIMALLLFAPIRGIRLFRTVYFMPFLMSTVAIGLLFIFILDPNFGLVNHFLSLLGLDSWQRGWLGESDTALWSVVAVISWQFAPFYMILFRASIVGIPDELYEAAKIDGANKWQNFIHVTLPLLMPTIVTSSILAIIGSLKYFDLIYVMTNGGPNNSTELMATYMYKQAFTNFNMGYGSAVSFGMFIIALIITLAVLGLDNIRKRGDVA
ncbi:sugar ABC transporter permease [Bacillus sp. FJAT-50079]|nr:sugar ABC transporter permease [Bacillus sp. FJAT-50079]